jgi:hypothetical protein
MEIKKNYIYGISKSLFLLSTSNIIIALKMFIVYILGVNTIWSDILIYGPILLIIIVLIRDKFTFSYVISCILALLHGLAHKFYPFLNSEIGVDKSIDVWQDQTIHLGQIIIFASLYYYNSNTIFKNTYLFLIIGNLVNVILGFYCWGKSCHDFYVWVSLFPALSSGLHFAIGSLYHTDKETATIGFILQGISSISTYFLFKSSDDILKLFALCRFFEIYFVVPHYVGYFHSRYKITKLLESKNRFFQILGIHNIPLLNRVLPYLENYFSNKKND